MLIYKDLFSGDELFTDSNKITWNCDGEILRVCCRRVTQEEGENFDIGANASQEEQAEEVDKVVKSGIDLVMNQSLEEVTHDYTKKTYLLEMKKYMKKIACDMKKKGKECEKDCFQKACIELAKEIKDKFDDIQFFRPPKDYEKETTDEEEPWVIPLHIDQATQEITMWFFKRGLKEEKF